MILDWLIYVCVTSALISSAACLAEHASRGRRGSRFVWIGAMLMTSLLPIAMGTLSSAAPEHSRPNAEPAPSLRHVTSITLAATPAMLLEPREQTSLMSAPLVGWAIASALMLATVAAYAVHLTRQKQCWQRASHIDVNAYVSSNTGPAVFGVVEPAIVLPDWFHGLPFTQQSMVVAHERSHIAAHDPQLMLFALLLLAAVPWNIALWWQFARLRRALEIDCDRRVLQSGASVRDYGEALIAVAQRRSETLRFSLWMTSARSFLERRIAAISQRNRKSSVAVALGLVVGSTCLVAAAAQITPPDRPSNLVTVSPETLERYVGAYRFAENTVMHVTHAADHLQIQFTGDSATDIFPQADDVFFFTDVGIDARIEFLAAGDTAANVAILRQNGAATQMPRIDSATAAGMESSVAARAATQTANPNSERALRGLIENILAGEVDRGRVNAQLAAALRNDLPKLQVRLAALGQPVSYRLKSVSSHGIDEYEVTHERGVVSDWGVLIDSNDVITSARVP